MKILKGILASFIFITSVVSCSSSDDDTNDCTRSKEASTLAETAYNIDKQNEVLCKNYKTALENEITTCGDTDGILQTKIDALGNCTFVDHGTLSVTVGTLNIEFSLINIELASGLIKVKGSKQGQGSDHSIYFELAENTTGVDIMQNFKLTLNGGEFFPNTDGFDDFTNNITVNSSVSIKGTFGGIVTRADGADLSLSQGVFDLGY